MSDTPNDKRRTRGLQGKRLGWLADISKAPLKHMRAGMRHSQNSPIYLHERPRAFLMDWCRNELSDVGLCAVWEHVQKSRAPSVAQVRVDLAEANSPQRLRILAAEQGRSLESPVADWAGAL